MDTAIRSRQEQQKLQDQIQSCLSSPFSTPTLQQHLARTLEKDKEDDFDSFPPAAGTICKYTSSRLPHYLASVDRPKPVYPPSDSGYSSLVPSANSSLSRSPPMKTDTNFDDILLPDEPIRLTRSRLRRSLPTNWPEPSVLMSLFDEDIQTRSEEPDRNRYSTTLGSITRIKPACEEAQRMPDAYDDDFDFPQGFGTPILSSKLNSTFSKPPGDVLAQNNSRPPPIPSLTLELRKSLQRRNSMPDVRTISREEAGLWKGTILPRETGGYLATKTRKPQRLLQKSKTLPFIDTRHEEDSLRQGSLPSSPNPPSDDSSSVEQRPRRYRLARRSRKANKDVPRATPAVLRGSSRMSSDVETEDEPFNERKRSIDSEEDGPKEVAESDVESIFDSQFLEDNGPRMLETAMTEIQTSLLQHLINDALAECVDEPEGNKSSGASSSSGIGQGPRITSPTLRSSALGNSKRCRDSGRDPNGEGDDSDDEDRPKKRNEKRPASDIPNRRLKCPFYQWKPEKYLRAACRGQGFADMAKLKDHIKRVHTQPLRCSRCWKEMKSDNMYTRHLQADVICRKAAEPRDNRLKPELLKSLDFKKLPFANAKNVEEKWKMLYSVLFPNERQIPSPYDQHGINPHLEKALAGALQDELSKELANVLEPILHRIKSRIPDIVQNCKLRLLRENLDEVANSDATRTHSTIESSECGNSDSDLLSQPLSGGQMSRATSPFSSSCVEVPLNQGLFSSELDFNNSGGLFDSNNLSQLEDGTDLDVPFENSYPNMILPDDVTGHNQIGILDESFGRQGTSVSLSKPSMLAKDTINLPYRNSPESQMDSESMDTSITPKGLEKKPLGQQNVPEAHGSLQADLENMNPAVSRWWEEGTMDNRFDFDFSALPNSGNDTVLDGEPYDQQLDLSRFFDS